MPIKIKRPTRIAANQRVTGKKILPYDPSYLFANGEAGVWYDPSDLSTMFQDAAGTIPVTGVEQPVGLMLDKSGRGNHASQSTTARRPVLSARYNLLTQTENFGDALWTKEGSVLVTSDAIDSPVGTRTADYFYAISPPGGFPQLRLVSLSVSSNTSYKFSIYARSGERSSIFVQIFNATENTFISTVTSSSSLTSNWTQLSGTFNTGSATSIQIRILFSGFTVSWTGTQGIYIWGADLRVANEGSTLPPYQRVGNPTAGSSTAAGTADYDTNGFPPYLRFDGTDDSLETSNINFSATDKVTVFAGVRKLSDTFGIITEFGPSSASNNNSFHLGSDTIYGFFSRGTSRTDATVDALSPRTDVLTGIGNISGDNTGLRLNFTQVDGDTGDQGTGPYGTYPLYIGARGGTANRFNGRLYSLIVRGAETTTLDLLNTEKWVSRKTGLTYTNNIENTVAREIFDRTDALVFDRQDSVIIRRT